MLTPHYPYKAVEGYFRISDARKSALKTEKVCLHSGLDASGGVLAHMAPATAIKGALGPWSP